MKRIISFMLIVVLSCSLLSLSAFADEYPEEGFDFEAYEAQEQIDGTPKNARWKYTSSTAQSLSIDNKEATAMANVTGYQQSVTKIVMYLYIQQLNNGSWKTLDSHRYEFNSWHAVKEITYSPCPLNYTYRLKASYYVYSGTQYEPITEYSLNFTYK